MHLYNGRSNIIKLFDDKDIKPSNFLQNAKQKPEPELAPQLESELESELEPESELEL